MFTNFGIANRQWDALVMLVFMVLTALSECANRESILYNSMMLQL